MSSVFAVAVYVLCFATSAMCAVLLARSYVRTTTRLLFWSALCFLFLAGNNLLVILDILIFPRIDLQLWRPAFALAGIGVLLFGFIWDLDD